MVLGIYFVLAYIAMDRTVAHRESISRSLK